MDNRTFEEIMDDITNGRIKELDIKTDFDRIMDHIVNNQTVIGENSKPNLTIRNVEYM